MPSDALPRHLLAPDPTGAILFSEAVSAPAATWNSCMSGPSALPGGPALNQAIHPNPHPNLHSPNLLLRQTQTIYLSWCFSFLIVFTHLDDWAAHLLPTFRFLSSLLLPAPAPATTKHRRSDHPPGVFQPRTCRVSRASNEPRTQPFHLRIVEAYPTSSAPGRSSSSPNSNRTAFCVPSR